MCDYSLHAIKTRPAHIADKLCVRDFGTGTRGFAAAEDSHIAVCLRPGTELAFTDVVRRVRTWPWSNGVIQHRTAIFRQINCNNLSAHHDALEFPDGQLVLLTLLRPGQYATVLQLPASAATRKAPASSTSPHSVIRR